MARRHARRAPHRPPTSSRTPLVELEHSTTHGRPSTQQPGAGELVALQGLVGNRAATSIARQRGPGGPNGSLSRDARPAAGALAIQRQVVDIGGKERLEIADGLSATDRAARTKEGRDILVEIKDKYGITISSKRSVKAILKDYFPGRRAPKAIRDQIRPEPWRIEELRNVRTALERYAPLLGKERKKSSDPATAGSKQSVTSIGKVGQALSPDASQPHGVEVETDTLGESFKSSKNIAFFESLATAANHNFVGDASAQQRGTTGHELCHALIEPGHLASFVATFDYWQDKNTRVADANRVSSATPKAEAPITRYGSTNAAEDLAEVAKFYFEEPARLKGGNGKAKGTPGNPTPDRLDFFDRIVLSWTKPPEEVAKARFEDLANDFLARDGGDLNELLAARNKVDDEYAKLAPAAKKRLLWLKFSVGIKFADLVTGG